MNITNIHAAAELPNLSEIDSNAQPAALEDILKSTLANANGDANAYTSAIEGHFSDSTSFSNPGQLVKLQTDISNYNIYVSLASALTRKAVSAVETIVKAQ
ncbi:type III secretion system protein [Burkholderia sp. ABCPW 14]|uniref:type III secretion system inner rod subunit SctI n=1 Tax=Burkholderia sp. ABCPW 14 TaxID=1637860 RepID=UPI000770DBF5|nr:type III secretion system inner rod subunit SctI [Burkholderia sp. ABCPW 14]KVD78004.1 type III secretion system protein [Burkholderia sp. ABCPW 14]